MQIRAFERVDSKAVVTLWQTCLLTRPWNDPYADIGRKLDEQPDLFLVGIEEGQLIASIMAGYDGHRGWIYYLAVAPGFRHRSFGRQLMTAIEHKLLLRGCPKINLMVRAENSEVRAFYNRLGYVQDDIIVLGKRLIPDIARV